MISLQAEVEANEARLSQQTRSAEAKFALENSKSALKFQMLSLSQNESLPDLKLQK